MHAFISKITSAVTLVLNTGVSSSIKPESNTLQLGLIPGILILHLYINITIEEYIKTCKINTFHQSLNILSLSVINGTITVYSICLKALFCVELWLEQHD